ncbi:MAG: class I SAM-dependent RNA methyltransferase [Clostridiales bacterium]|jgi:putative N6-adenine-specific DNA methylase|nr:class I SAM-dependent RNA methyltransferase [Clostridiales bacterium]
MDKITLIATAAFGLEAVVGRELSALGFAAKASDGQLRFEAVPGDIPKANIWLRSADRVFAVVGGFAADTFDALFEGTKALPWPDWLPFDARINVSGKSVRSKLFSVSDCQSIVKKAIIESMKRAHHVETFPESGAEYKIQVSLLRDAATLSIDTSGAGLHKRGYRLAGVEAPMKETLAAGLVALSFYRADRALLDPCCGSGTIPIEAALIARNAAPGLSRAFAGEYHAYIPKLAWTRAREEARARVREDVRPTIFASDIDRRATEAAKGNALRADVKRFIRFETKPLAEATLPSEYGVMIANPPYGDRLATRAETEKLYSELGTLAGNNKKWSSCVITSDEYFEKSFGRRADAKRKLYNGMIKTDYYQFHGEQPPRHR